MERALVTGAHGVVGRWLVAALLERGTEVVVLARRPGRPSALVLDGLEARCTVVAGALADSARLARALAGCEAVFHLAAASLPSAPAPELQETNVEGTRAVLEACRRAGVGRVVLASSGRVYGPAGAPHAESAPLAPADPYAASKVQAEALARASHAEQGLRVAAARTANVYGPGDLQRSRLVPELVASVLAGRPPRVHSDGSPVRDLVFAADVAAAYLAVADALAASGAGGEAFNVGGGTPRPVREVVALLLALAGSSAVPAWGPSPAAPDRQALDSAKLRARTGWAPRVGLEEGLARTLAWHRAHPEALGPS